MVGASPAQLGFGLRTMFALWFHSVSIIGPEETYPSASVKVMSARSGTVTHRVATYGKNAAGDDRCTTNVLGSGASTPKSASMASTSSTSGSAPSSSAPP
jgi:hypothetical protein